MRRITEEIEVRKFLKEARPYAPHSHVESRMIANCAQVAMMIMPNIQPVGEPGHWMIDNVHHFNEHQMMARQIEHYIGRSYWLAEPTIAVPVENQKHMVCYAASLPPITLETKEMQSWKWSKAVVCEMARVHMISTNALFMQLSDVSDQLYNGFGIVWQVADQMRKHATESTKIANPWVLLVSFDRIYVDTAGITFQSVMQ